MASILIAAAISAVPVVASFSQTTEPATMVATGEPLKITVTGFEGMVQYRASETDTWKAVENGLVLSENAEFRTGMKSAVRFTIPPDQTVTLDRVGVIKVLQAVQDGKKVKTKLGMKYGRTRYDIEAAGLEHESTIASPSSTLAVRGTQVIQYDQRPFPSQAISLTGRAEFQDFKKRVALGSKGGGTIKVDENSSSPAAYASLSSTVDPNTSTARSPAETPLISNLLSHGATVDYDFDKNIRVIRGGRPPGEEELSKVLPGRLNFVMRWTNDTDLNLGVISPGLPGANRTVYPVGGLNLVASGGRTDFDHRGGKEGGIEVVYWPKTFPQGVYSIGAVHISGVNSPGTVEVYLDGKKMPILTGQGNVEKAEFIGKPINPEIASGVGVGLVRLTTEQGATPLPEGPKPQRAARKK
jgi:hypothetical protein